jgi:molecular chaperone DnaK
MASNDAVNRTIGIDLGTTNCVVAYLDHAGIPKSVVNFEGDVCTPSRVFVDKEIVLVGREAEKAAPSAGGDYAHSAKRYIGRDLYPQTLCGRHWRPEELSAVLLRRLKNDAERRLGRVDASVVTVPAYFDECRRRATCDSAKIARCPVVDLINEPTAAAIAYAYREGRLKNHNGTPERVFVFDLGGGTMDATILDVRHGKEYRTVATDGEVQLGGVDWDLRLCEHLSEQFLQQTGSDPMAEQKHKVAMLLLAEKAKLALSTKDKARIPAVIGPHRAALKVERTTFEELTLDLVERARLTMAIVLEQAGLKWADIDTVLSVGGSTRMPMIERLLREESGKEPNHSLSRDEAVAHGAAIYARLLQDNGEVRVTNVNSLTYRAIAKPPGKPAVAHPLIPKNSPLPSIGTHVFRTAKAGQRTCKIQICDGESQDPNLCNRIGKVVIDDLEHAGDKRWYVKVNLICREDGQLVVQANVYDPDNLSRPIKKAHATIEPVHGMTDLEIRESQTLIDSLELG